MPAGELLQRISSRELSEWMAFFQLEPWGCEMEDWRAGMIASIIANVNRDMKKQRKPYEPQDFMPKRAVATEEQDADEIERALKMWEAVLGRRSLNF